MTVCIAAICENGIIYGASDRMLTSGDIEFEPDLDSITKPELPGATALAFNSNTKIYAITNSLVVMTAGDSGLQCEIVQDMLIQVNNVLQTNQHQIAVREAVGMYLEAYEKAKNRRAHQMVLAKYYLDMPTFLAKSSQMSPHLVAEINQQIQRFDSLFAEMHGVETIITGTDHSFGNDRPSAHIYSVIKVAGADMVTCCDAVGFATVGSGGRHAASQFMLAGHSPFSSSPETLLLTYLAKKRSEVAPGVGKGTDMFVIGRGVNNFAMLQNIKDFDMKKIESIYNSVDAGQKKAFKNGLTKTKDYIDGLFKARNDKQAKAEEAEANRKREFAHINNPVTGESGPSQMHEINPSEPKE